MRDGSHIPASEFHTRFTVERDKQVDELWEKVKDYPNLDKALADLEKAGFFPHRWIVRF
jgi:hypothetical protein